MFALIVFSIAFVLATGFAILAVIASQDAPISDRNLTDEILEEKKREEIDREKPIPGGSGWSIPYSTMVPTDNPIMPWVRDIHS
mgnify:CR=1 FL=1